MKGPVCLTLFLKHLQKEALSDIIHLDMKSRIRHCRFAYPISIVDPRKDGMQESAAANVYGGRAEESFQ